MDRRVAETEYHDGLSASPGADRKNRPPSVRPDYLEGEADEVMVAKGPDEKRRACRNVADDVCAFANS